MLWVGVGVTLTILNNNLFQIETNIKTQHPIQKQLIFSGGQTDPNPTPKNASVDVPETQLAVCTVACLRGYARLVVVVSVLAGHMLQDTFCR